MSANPGGRPKRDVSAEIARAVFEGNAEAVYRVLANRLIRRGDPYAFKELADRGYGKVRQGFDLDARLTVEQIGALTPAELDQRIEILLKQWRTDRKKAGSDADRKLELEALLKRRKNLAAAEETVQMLLGDQIRGEERDRMVRRLADSSQFYGEDFAERHRRGLERLARDREQNG